MIKTLAVKRWTGVAIGVIFCLVLGVPMLYIYGPSALLALRGYVPRLARTESMSNIYGISAMGLFFVVLAIAMVIRHISISVSRQVKRYLAANPGTNMEQLEQDFAAAERFGNVWLGKRWTFSHDMDAVLVGNDRIRRVFSESERPSLRSSRINYYLCLELADGKTVRVQVPKNELPKMTEWYEKYFREADNNARRGQIS